MRRRCLKEILTSNEVQAAWELLRNGIPARSNANGPDYLFDDLGKWLCGQGNRQLNQSIPPIDMVAKLYIVSEFGLINEVMEMINGNIHPNVVIQGQVIDPDGKVVMNNKRRFRHGLSEHLSFWIRAGQAAYEAGRKGLSKPNFQPEDKGPDGVYINVNGDEYSVEAISVKSSEKDPKKLISSANFRKTGKPGKSKKMLDDFQKMLTESFGVTRLQDKVVEVGNLLKFDANSFIKSGFLAEIKCHGVSVSDHSYSSPSLYEGYDNLVNIKDQRIATHLGADKWTDFAEEVRKACKAIFVSKAAW